MIQVAVALGGAAGALARYGIGLLAASLAAAAFPWGTLVVNACGSCALGLLMRVLPGTTVTPAVRASLTVGFCGGFTTFSTFAAETVAFARQGEVHLAAAYVAASLLLGLSGLVAGMGAGALLVSGRSGVLRPIARGGGEPRGRSASPDDRR